MQGLAQSNNNARLNYSAKHITKLLEQSAKGGARLGKKEHRKRSAAGSAHGLRAARTEPAPKQTDRLPPCCFLLLFFFFFFFFLEKLTN
jgi:hypothetical protein